MSEGEQRLSCPECVSRKGKQTEKKGQSVSHSNIHEAVIRHLRYNLHIWEAHHTWLILTQKSPRLPLQRTQCQCLVFSEEPRTFPAPTCNYFLLKTAVYTSLSETHFSPEVKRLQVPEMLLALSTQQSSASTCNLMKTAAQGIIYV